MSCIMGSVVPQSDMWSQQQSAELGGRFFPRKLNICQMMKGTDRAWIFHLQIVEREAELFRDVKLPFLVEETDVTQLPVDVLGVRFNSAWDVVRHS